MNPYQFWNFFPCVLLSRSLFPSPCFTSFLRPVKHSGGNSLSTTELLATTYLKKEKKLFPNYFMQSNKKPSKERDFYFSVEMCLF